MAEMAEVAKVLVQEQHSHLFTIQPVSIRNKIVTLNKTSSKSIPFILNLNLILLRCMSPVKLLSTYIESED